MTSTTGIPSPSDPWQIAQAHEQAGTDEQRRARGAWYTPRALAVELVAMTLPGTGPIPGFVVDPSCGGGGFLLAVLDRLVALGLRPAEALERIGGIDIDAGAVTASRAAVSAWAALHGGDGATGCHGGEAVAAALGRAQHRIVQGDQLEGWPTRWPPVEVVVGNPPFATPLRGRPFPPAAAEARWSRRDRLGPYADLAAIHLAVAIESSAPGARVAMVLPQSLLAGRDSAGLRAWIDAEAPIQTVWASAEELFDASVRVWAPVLQRRVPSEAGDTGVGDAGVGDTGVGAEPTWSERVAEALGQPVVRLQNLGTSGPTGRARPRTLAELIDATAGFRDEYYALAAACREATADERALLGGAARDHGGHADHGERAELGAAPHPGDGTDPTVLRVVTVGALDPLVSYWGRRPIRFAKRQWEAPVVDLDALTGTSRQWFGRRSRAKVLLPTQSKIFEPVVDRAGLVAPVTPVLSLHADPAEVDRVAAVLLAPPVVAWAHARWFGSAMSARAIKVAARDLGAIALPPDSELWDQAAALVAAADHAPEKAPALAMAAAELMHQAYTPLLADTAQAAQVWKWWLGRASPLVVSTYDRVGAFTPPATDAG